MKLNYFWIKKSSSSSIPDACYYHGRVWVGSIQGTEEEIAARYHHGFIWLGKNEGSKDRPDGRYKVDKYNTFYLLRIGNKIKGVYDARYSNGRVWLDKDINQENFDASYTSHGEDFEGGVAACIVLLLLQYKENEVKTGEIKDKQNSNQTKSDNIETNLNSKSSFNLSSISFLFFIILLLIDIWIRIIPIK